MAVHECASMGYMGHMEWQDRGKMTSMLRQKTWSLLRWLGNIIEPNSCPICEITWLLIG